MGSLAYRTDTRVDTFTHADDFGHGNPTDDYGYDYYTLAVVVSVVVAFAVVAVVDSDVLSVDVVGCGVVDSVEFCVVGPSVVDVGVTVPPLQPTGNVDGQVESLG